MLFLTHLLWDCVEEKEEGPVKANAGEPDGRICGGGPSMSRLRWELNRGVRDALTAFTPGSPFTPPWEHSIIQNQSPLQRCYKSKRDRSQITNGLKDDCIWHVPLTYKYFFPTAAFPVKLILKKCENVLECCLLCYLFAKVSQMAQHY